MNFKNAIVEDKKVSKIDLVIHKFKIIYRILFAKHFFVVIRQQKNEKNYNSLSSHNISLKKVADIACDIFVNSIEIEYDNVEGQIEVKK